MAFVGHEPCPSCRSLGKDQKGNNLARYSNGSAFCFSCRYMEKPTNYRPAVPKDPVKPPEDLTNQFHEDNLKWLKQYLNPSEISAHFRYSPSYQRHVYQNEGYWEARSVNENRLPKVLSHGSKPFVLFGEGDPIVVVEDVVSAIKVARVCSVVPLFGSHFPGDWMVRIAKLKPSRVVVWLDQNKIADGRDFAAKFNLIYPFARALATKLDPKCYSEEDLKRFLGIPDDCGC